VRENLAAYHQLALIYHTDLVALWAEANRKWLTEKAKINELLKIIPRKYRLERLIFKKENQVGIRKTMERVLKEGSWVGLRSCYLSQPLGKAPWIMALKSRRAVRLFFEKRKKGQRKLWQGTPAHYDEWLKDSGLKEIVVMFNPPLLCPKYRKEHFVARVEIYENTIRIEIRLNTDQLRDAENVVERSDLITLRMSHKDTFHFERKPIIASFGRRYFRKRVRLPEKKTIEMFDGIFGEFKPQNSKYEKLVKAQVLKIAYQVSTTIFDEWCSAPFNLCYRLEALRRFGLGIIEVQGRIEKGEIVWMRVYGLRGAREVSSMPTT